MEDAMKYMLLIYGAEGAWTGEERTACMVDSLAVCDQLAKQGKFLDAAPLQPAAAATCVRVRDNKRTITDGPFAETNEVIGGYFLIRAKSREEALAVAARMQTDCSLSVEVRPLFDMSGLRNSVAIS